MLAFDKTPRASSIHFGLDPSLTAADSALGLGRAGPFPRCPASSSLWRDSKRGWQVARRTAPSYLFFQTELFCPSTFIVWRAQGDAQFLLALAGDLDLFSLSYFSGLSSYQNFLEKCFASSHTFFK